MKKALLLIILLFTPNFAFSGVQLSLSNRAYYQGDIINAVISIQEDYSGPATLKICLSNYDFIQGSYSQKCDTLLQEHELAINHEYQSTFLIDTSSMPDSVYRIYLQLKFKQDGLTKTRQSCNDNNFILIKPIASSHAEQCASGITLFANTTSAAYPGSQATAEVAITNYGNNEDILLYSYIKNQTTYINENLNDDSFKALTIAKGSKSEILLKNNLIESIGPGTYLYTITAESAGKTYQTTNTIEIIEEKEDENNCPICPECPIVSECEISQTIPAPLTESPQEQETPNEPMKITAQLNLKRDEYYYIPIIIIGIASLIIMYAKIK